MRKSVTFTIPAGCNENWDSMTAVQQGRHCNSCQKTVIDFTEMTDNQLINFFKKDSERVCGRFHPGQLNQELIIPTKKINFFKYFFQFTIPAFLFSLKSSAQTRSIPDTSIIETKPKDITPVSTDSSRNISGYIKDSDGIPIPYVSIFTPEKTFGTVSDADGKFNLKIPKKINMLTITSVGYNRVDIKVSEETQDIILVKLYRAVLGEIVVVRTKKIKKNKVIKPVDQTNTILLYPNPVKASSTLNLSWANLISDDQYIEIYDAAGKLVQQEIKHINSKSTLEKINLALIQPGMYVLKVTDSKTHKSLSLNFIAE